MSHCEVRGEDREQGQALHHYQVFNNEMTFLLFRNIPHCVRVVYVRGSWVPEWRPAIFIGLYSGLVAVESIGNYYVKNCMEFRNGVVKISGDFLLQMCEL